MSQGVSQAEPSQGVAGASLYAGAVCGGKHLTSFGSVLCRLSECMLRLLAESGLELSTDSFGKFTRATAVVQRGDVVLGLLDLVLELAVPARHEVPPLVQARAVAASLVVEVAVRRLVAHLVRLDAAREDALGRVPRVCVAAPHLRVRQVLVVNEQVRERRGHRCEDVRAPADVQVRVARVKH
eukprot:134691-Rhodomonas_salina.1